MALREDFGRGDSARIYEHLNEITRGVNQIGQTWRGVLAGAQTSLRVDNDRHYAPQLFVPGPPWGMYTTMDPLPARSANGRAWTFPPGPYEFGFQVNWDSLNVDGIVWCGIQQGADDAGADYFGNLTGIQIAESPPQPIRPGVVPLWSGVTAIARCHVDLRLNEKILFWFRHNNTTNGSTLDVRRGAFRTYAWATRLGH